VAYITVKPKQKVYLMRWRIEKFYRFKKQQFGVENLRVGSLKSIRNLELLLTVEVGDIGFGWR